MLPTFQKWTFCKGMYGENDGPSRNIHSDHNQMRACVECSPNQSKNYTFIGLSIDETLKIPERCWLFLYMNPISCIDLFRPPSEKRYELTIICQYECSEFQDWEGNERRSFGLPRFAHQSSLKATSHSTISMHGQRGTGKIQRNNYHHGSCGPSLTGKTMSVFLIFTQGTHRNVKNR